MSISYFSLLCDFIRLIFFDDVAHTYEAVAKIVIFLNKASVDSKILSALLLSAILVYLIFWISLCCGRRQAHIGKCTRV